MRKTIISLVTAAMSFAAVASHADGEVNLYSYRQPFLIEPMLEEFTKQTGTKVNVVFAKKGMVEKIKAAGDNNPADAVLTVDIGRLDALHKAGLLEGVDSAALSEAIPANLRHPDGLWFGLTTPGPPRPDLEGSREAGRAGDARRPRGPEVQGTNLHPVRQARVQRRAHRLGHRPRG